MKPIYIFDIDGTISLPKERLKYLSYLDDKDRWNKFYNDCNLDLPNIPIIKIMESLRLLGSDILFFTGRPDRVRDKTIDWITENTSFMSFDFEKDILIMRDDNDYTPDFKLKEYWYDNMLLDDKNSLVCVFEDRTQVVEMWRRKGVVCLQVQDGKY